MTELLDLPRPESGVLLAEVDWTARRAAHQARVDGWLAGHRERRSRGRSHPVEDFLFEYYNQRPYQLRRWHPGPGVVLAGPAAAELLSWRGYVEVEAGVTLDTSAVLASRAATVRWVRDLLTATAGRAGYFGCFGLHEWAMVYRQSADELRHPGWPLRMPAEAVAAVVEERGVRCGHVDAFRFFTPAARPLNLLQPTRADQTALEQPGCLHANMDLYKWTYKLSPLVPSDLVADAFALAREIRELDMRASPYDFTALGLEPVAVETPEGRAAYATAQRQFAARSAPLRQRLLDVLDPLLAG
nr:3-methyladenine DNA glycosylase [uncultured Friedmanniella sp.]